jgi:hypothetical protein
LLASQHAGLPATAALTCAVVASAIVALWGGTTLGLSGPGLAMSFALVQIARAHGAAGLALAGAICGLLQLLFGALGVGRFARLVPLTAGHAFVFGMGVLLVIQSLRAALVLFALASMETLLSASAEEERIPSRSSCSPIASSRSPRSQAWSSRSPRRSSTTGLSGRSIGSRDPRPSCSWGRRL